MPFTFDPGPGWRFVLKRGMVGEDVAALQLNLHGVPVDGEFGGHTETAVKGFQKKRGLVDKDGNPDGIPGSITQTALCVHLSTDAARAHELPKGLLKSLMSNESGLYVAAVAVHADGTFDVGAYQKSFPDPPSSQESYRHAYSIVEMAEETAEKIATQHDLFDNPAPGWYLEHIGGGDKARFAWQLAVLYHNWPVASNGIHERGSIFVDASRDTQPQQWIIDATKGRLRTSREWVVSYIQRATVYVVW